MIVAETPFEEELLLSARWFIAHGYSSLTIERHEGKIRIIEREKVKTFADLIKA